MDAALNKPHYFDRVTQSGLRDFCQIPFSYRSKFSNHRLSYKVSRGLTDLTKNSYSYVIQWGQKWTISNANSYAFGPLLSTLNHIARLIRFYTYNTLEHVKDNSSKDVQKELRDLKDIDVDTYIGRWLTTGKVWSHNQNVHQYPYRDGWWRFHWDMIIIYIYSTRYTHA